jgi:AcrR family transcriptional regulator
MSLPAKASRVRPSNAWPSLWGVKEATLFHYFSGKQELLTAVLAERDRRSRDIGGLAEFGLPVLASVAERNKKEPGLTTLYAVASATANDPGHASHGYFQDRYSQLVEELALDIGRRQDAGEVRSASRRNHSRDWSSPPSTAFSCSGCTTRRWTWPAA